MALTINRYLVLIFCLTLTGISEAAFSASLYGYEDKGYIKYIDIELKPGKQKPSATKMSHKELIANGYLELGFYNLEYYGSSKDEDCDQECVETLKKSFERKHDQHERLYRQLASEKNADIFSVTQILHSGAERQKQVCKQRTYSTSDMVFQNPDSPIYQNKCQIYDYITYRPAYYQTYVALYTNRIPKNQLALKKFLDENSEAMVIEIFNGKTALFEKALSLGMDPNQNYANLVSAGSLDNIYSKTKGFYAYFLGGSSSIYRSAVDKKHYEILRLGLEYGVSPKTEMWNDGDTLKEIIKKSGDEEMMTILKESLKKRRK